MLGEGALRRDLVEAWSSPSPPWLAVSFWCPAPTVSGAPMPPAPKAFLCPTPLPGVLQSWDHPWPAVGPVPAPHRLTLPFQMDKLGKNHKNKEIKPIAWLEGRAPVVPGGQLCSEGQSGLVAACLQHHQVSCCRLLLPRQILCCTWAPIAAPLTCQGWSRGVWEAPPRDSSLGFISRGLSHLVLTLMFLLE